MIGDLCYGVGGMETTGSYSPKINKTQKFVTSKTTITTKSVYVVG